jgi:hypothetical protein
MKIERLVESTSRSIFMRGGESGFIISGVKTPAAAPKARNVKAWAIGPGETIRNLLSAEGAKYGCPLDNDNYFRMTRTLSCLQPTHGRTSEEKSDPFKKRTCAPRSQ